MQVTETHAFKNVAKKLHANQRKILDIAIKDILTNLQIGKVKTGDLKDVYVYKFNMNAQLMLLGYKYTDTELKLIYLGVHENFYRDLKKIIVK